MTQERITPLRERVIEDIRIRGIGEKAQATETAHRIEYRGSRRSSGGGSWPRPEVPRGVRHWLWCRAAGGGGVQPEDHRYRQQSHADPCR